MLSVPTWRQISDSSLRIGLKHGGSTSSTAGPAGAAPSGTSRLVTPKGA